MAYAGTKKRKLDILNGNIWSSMVMFAIPIALSSLLQQLFNAADQAVVGQFAGSASLAAVGANTSLVGLFVNVFTAMSVGSNAQIAIAIGSGKRENISKIVHTSITFAAAAGVILLVLAQFLAAPVHRLIGTPDNVFPLAVVYMKIYALGFPFALLYNFGSAVLRSKGDTKRPMIALTSAGVLNVILNLVFVIGFKLGVMGVAIATSISNVLSAGLVISFLLKEKDDLKLMPGKLGIDPASLRSIIRIGGPAGIQSAVFSFANVSIQSGINSLGSAAMAGSAAAQNFEYVSYFVTNAFAQGITTFCGQNYGAGKFERCKKIIKIAYVEDIIGVMILNSLVVLSRVPLVSFFSTDPDVAHYAYIRLFIVVGPHFLITSYELLAAAMRSMGYALVPALLTIIGCVAFRVTWQHTVFALFRDFKVLMVVYPASWIVTGSLVAIYYLLNRKKMFRG